MKSWKDALCLQLVAIVILTVNGQELDLMRFMFNENKYDKRILPNVGLYGPLNVTVGLTIHRIEDLVEKSQQLVTHAVLHLTWNDPHLGWKKLVFGGIENITVKPGLIWLPDIVLFNSANQDYSSRRIGQMRPTIHHDGNVTIDCPVLLNTICQVDVLHYPLDRQKCDLVFGSWTHNSDQISVKSMPNMFDLSRYIANGEWEITGTKFEQHLEFYDSGNLAVYDVTFEIILRRRVLYYIMYLIAPGTIIALLTGIIFVLPQDCSERITVGMAILVALSFFFLLVSETMPASSNNSIIGEFYSITMVEITISFFLNIIVLRFHHMTEEKVPHWVKKYILNYGARLLRLTSRVENQQLQIMKRQQYLLTTKQKVSTIVHDQEQKLSNKILSDDAVIADVIKAEIKMAARDAEWKKAAEVLNIFSLIFHILIVVITFLFVFVDIRPHSH